MKLDRDKILNTIGFTLFGLCFLSALWSVATRTARELNPNIVTIRFAHWQLEGGLVDTFDKMAANYEKIQAARGRTVRVEQLPVPERIFSNWVLTQLVGGTAPEIIQLGGGVNLDRKARFFEPLTNYVNEPNPYNEGTHLAGRPWRNTFQDGMQSVYDQNLLEYYAIPISAFTIRLFYNKELYERIFGAGTPPPQNYREFIAACEKIVAYGKEHNLSLVPIAGSKYNEGQLTGRFMGMMTQRLTFKINRRLSMIADHNETLLAFLRGEWNIRSPEVTAGLRLVQSFYRFFQPGFQQLDRDSGTLYFVQGRCVFIATGSWDNTSFRIQAPFEIGVCYIPTPTKDDPEFGKFLLGPPAESAGAIGMPFGVVRTAPNMEVALDFLKYVTSYEGNSFFAQNSGWLPSVVDVQVPEFLQPFMPRENTFPVGFGLGGGGLFEMITGKTHYLLQKFPDSPERFQEAYEKFDVAGAIAEDLQLWVKTNFMPVIRIDTLSTSYRELDKLEPENPSHLRKFYELLEQQIQTENDIYSNDWELSRILTRKKN